MSENEVFYDDGISLFELLQKLRAGWRWLVGGVLLGGLGAALAVAILPNQYEAVAIVQVGQIGQVAQVGQIG